MVDWQNEAGVGNLVSGKAIEKTLTQHYHHLGDVNQQLDLIFIESLLKEPDDEIKKSMYKAFWYPRFYYLIAYSYVIAFHMRLFDTKPHWMEKSDWDVYVQEIIKIIEDVWPEYEPTGNIVIS